MTLNGMIVYILPGSPKCVTLKDWLKEHNIVPTLGGGIGDLSCSKYLVLEREGNIEL